MKTNERKTFVILAVFLMIVVSFAPAITSVKTVEATNNGEPNVEVEIIKIEYLRYELSGQEAIYEVTYNITYENAYFRGYDIDLLYANSDGGYTDYTIVVDEPFEGSGIITGSAEIVTRSEIFSDDDEERFFLRDVVELKVTAYPGGGLLTSEDPIIATDTAYPVYWNQNGDRQILLGGTKVGKSRRFPVDH